MIETKKDKKLIIASFIVGILYSAIYEIGKKLLSGQSIFDLVNYYKAFIKYFCIITGRGILLSLILCGVLKLIKLLWKSNKSVCLNNRRKIILFVMILLPFSLAYMVYYPSMTSYDAYSIIGQAIGLFEKSNFHPFLYTYILSLLYKLELFFGYKGLAVILMTLIQIFSMSVAITEIIIEVSQNKTIRVLITCVAFFILFLPIQIMTLAITKDVLFSVCFIMLVLELKKAVDKNVLSFKDRLLICLWAALSALLRNNFVYVLVVLFLVGIMFRKDIIRPIRGCFLITIGLFILVQLIYRSFGVTGTNNVEMLSLPINQIARTYTLNYENLSEKQIKLIEYYLPAVGDYQPMNADYVKNKANDEAFNSSEGLRCFFALWAEVMKDNLWIYVDEMFYLHLPYLINDIYLDIPYVETSNAAYEIYPIERVNALPVFSEIYADAATNYEGFKQFILLRFPFSLAIPFWLLIISFLLSVFYNNEAGIINASLGLLLMGTYFLGPLSNFRYVYPIAILYPYYLDVIAECLNKNE